MEKTLYVFTVKNPHLELIYEGMVRASAPQNAAEYALEMAVAHYEPKKQFRLIDYVYKNHSLFIFKDIGKKIDQLYHVEIKKLNLIEAP